MARDRFGKKPLYYTHHDGHFLFASEVKALLRICSDPRPNYQRLIEWSLFRNADFGSPDTLIDGLSSLQPGHFVRICRARLGTPQSYYSPASQVRADVYERFMRASPQTVTAEIESLIQAGVRARLVSDVPLGTLCSGGIDSSLITALCARDLSHVQAFHVSVAGYPDLDERPYAQQVTDSLGIALLTYPMTADAFRRNLPRAIYHSDFPLTHPNSVAFLLISEFARRHGVVVLLSGEAADELFGGYMQRYRRYRQFLWAQWFLGLLPAKARKVVALAGYASEGIPATTFSEYEGLLAHTTGFLDKFSRNDLRLRCEEAYRFVARDSERAVLAAMLADLTNFLTPLLRRLDRMSMAASVECRTPFLDHHLVRAIVNLPLSYRLRGRTDKWMLKEIAVKYVPRKRRAQKEGGLPASGERLPGTARQEGVLHQRILSRCSRDARTGLARGRDQLGAQRARVLQHACPRDLGTSLLPAPAGRGGNRGDRRAGGRSTPDVTGRAGDLRRSARRQLHQDCRPISRVRRLSRQTRSKSLATGLSVRS